MVKCLNYRFVLLIYVAFTSALEPLKDLDENDIKPLLVENLKDIPDIESKYVINEGISKMISKYYKGKINAFPLYKLSLKIDRQPVRIPWTLDNVSAEDRTPQKKRYQYVKQETTLPPEQ